ncbi:MAG: hypothetical protein ACFFDH_20990 [Promethearchaeota archaeon]
MNDRNYYIDLHESNKKYLESLNLESEIGHSVRIIDRDKDSLLVDLIKRETNTTTSYRYIRVKDSSIGKNYFLSVPNKIRTCREAISWTFGLKPLEYDLLFET